MSHAGLAIVIVGVGAWVGLTRGRASTGGTLGVAIVLGCAALAFHVIELLAT